MSLEMSAACLHFGNLKGVPAFMYVAFSSKWKVKED